MGQYNTKLYYNRERTYSSWIGGVLTIIFILIVIDILVTELYSIFIREDYVVDEKSLNFKESELFNMTFS